MAINHLVIMKSIYEISIFIFDSMQLCYNQLNKILIYKFDPMCIALNYINCDIVHIINLTSMYAGF